MKILVDENIPLITVQALREMAHEVLDIRGTLDEGASDEILWKISQREGQLLITTDKGFTEYREKLHHGHDHATDDRGYTCKRNHEDQA